MNLVRLAPESVVELSTSCLAPITHCPECRFPFYSKVHQKQTINFPNETVIASKGVIRLSSTRKVRRLARVLINRVKKAESQRIDAFKTMELEKILESPLENKGIKPVNPKGYQP